MNPAVEPRRNVRITVIDGVIAEICDVPEDELTQTLPIAVTPRFVNAHTHLEFSDLTAPLPPPQPFTEWIRSVVKYRRNLPVDQIDTAIRQGWGEATAAGCKLIGEITTSDEGATALSGQTADGNAAAISFRELLGFTADRIGPQLEVAKQHLSSQTASDWLVAGLSPHAPYSVHPELFQASIELAAEYSCPVTMHLGETLGEIELLSDQRGPFVDFLTSLHLWDASTLSRGTKILDYLRPLAKLPHALAVHCNYLSSAEIDFLGRHPNVAVIYCPRTHAWFGHQNHPWQQLKTAGATVVLGTDSRASNPDLSIWKELQYVARKSKQWIWDLLPMITTTAAKALGQPAEAFTLKVGQRFNAVTFAVHSDSPSELHRTLIQEAVVPESD